MENADLISYLKKFETFGVAKIQRFNKWGYERAINKIIDLVDAGLIHEIPDSPLLFKFSDLPHSLPAQSFRITLQNREIPPLRIYKTRIWFESLGTQVNTNLTSAKVKSLIHINNGTDISIINSTSRMRLEPYRMRKLVKFKNKLILNPLSETVIFLVHRIADIKAILHLLKTTSTNKIKKLYILGSFQLLNEIKIHL